MNNDKLQQIIIHIGGHKSGSTSIQDFCFEDKRLLSGLGFYYPANLFEPYPRQHSHLAKLLISGATEQIEEAFATIAARASEVKAHSVFLSGEDLGVMGARHVSELSAYCERYFNKRRFVFVARNRRDFILSSYKHHLRYASIISEIEFARTFRFSPRDVIDAWRANFSLDAVFLHYDEMTDNFTKSFFWEVFGVQVDRERYSNVSLDFLTSSICNIILKEWRSEEINRILWKVSHEHKSPMSFAVEEKIAEALTKSLSDEDWNPIEYRGRRSLLADNGPQQTRHDPVEVCDKMLSLFQLLRSHFEQRRENQKDTSA